MHELGIFRFLRYVDFAERLTVGRLQIRLKLVGMTLATCVGAGKGSRVRGVQVTAGSDFRQVVGGGTTRCNIHRSLRLRLRRWGRLGAADNG